MPSREEDEPRVSRDPALTHIPRHRPRSGARPVDAVIEAIRDCGYREPILRMLEGNRRAEAFYERRGWGRDGGGAADYPKLTDVAEAERLLEVELGAGQPTQPEP